jgi:hypothetical protein
MDKALRQKAYSLVKLLADSCQHTFVPTKDERELLEILADTLKILMMVLVIRHPIMPCFGCIICLLD